VNICNLIIQRKRGNGSKELQKIGKVTSYTAQPVKDENGKLVVYYGRTTKCLEIPLWKTGIWFYR